MRTVLAALVVVSLLLSCRVQAATPSALTEELSRLAGESAVDCSPEDKQIEVHNAFRCASEAIAARKAFVVVVRVGCADCSYWVAAAGSDDARVWHVSYDTNPTGSREDAPELESRECASLEFDSAGFPYILCISAM